jgi:hypothetical protein
MGTRFLPLNYTLRRINLRKTIFTLLIFLLGGAFMSPVFALEFSADVVQKIQGRTMSSKMFLKDNKMRWEDKSTGNYTVIRQDLNKAWIIFPKEKAYTEMISETPKQIPEQRINGEVKRKLIGPATINGHPTQKYEVISKRGDKEYKAYQWIATDMNYPIKMAGTDGSWSAEYKNIKTTDQPDSLFELPAGYRKMMLPAMPGSKGMGTPPEK